MVDLAVQLIEKKTAPFDAAKFEDHFQTALKQLVQDKMKGNRVVATAYLTDDQLIREVYDVLLLARNKHRVEVHADKNVPWSVLKKVLHTTKAAGFEELSLVAANAASM